jgi:chloramphenicol 3-O-phosphotransferase
MHIDRLEQAREQRGAMTERRVLAEVERVVLAVADVVCVGVQPKSWELEPAARELGGGHGGWRRWWSASWVANAVGWMM